MKRHRKEKRHKHRSDKDKKSKDDHKGKHCKRDRNLLNPNHPSQKMEEKKHKKKRIKEVSNFKDASKVNPDKTAVDSEARKEISLVNGDKKRKMKGDGRSEEEMVVKRDDDKMEKEGKRKKTKEAENPAKELNGEIGGKGDQTEKDKSKKKKRKRMEEESGRDSKKEKERNREKKKKKAKTDNLGDTSAFSAKWAEGDGKHGGRSDLIVERKKKKEKHLENEQEVGDKVNDENVKEKKKSKKKKATHEAQTVKEKDMKKLPSKRGKRVTFADEVQIFPVTNNEDRDDSAKKRQIVHSKRFSPEEDELLKEAVFKFIESRDLGEEGLDMVLHCKEHVEVRNCWREIGSYIPWRPHTSVYHRAHTIFKRSENTTWSTEECDIIRNFHEKHGPDWKTLAEALGRHRVHVKDTWRRIKLENSKKGPWSQDEYKCLFDSVNMDLRMRSLEDKPFNSRHGMLRDNIPWEAISQKLSTRNNALCCTKWYNQLTSPMVSMGMWADTDDYRLLDALVSLDACSMEDVDWDNLIEHRSGDVCRKRWNQMVHQIVDHSIKSFPEQVDILSKRYCPELIDAREAWDEKKLQEEAGKAKILD